MKDFLLKSLRAAVAALALLAPSEGALAQTVTQQPAAILGPPATATDLGNGPLELKIVQGNSTLLTMTGAGVGQTSGGQSGTSITLTATPTNAPCIGCLLSAAFNNGVSSTVTIPAGTVITAFSGTTSVTMSTSVTVATGASLSWGSACPSTSIGITGVIPLQASVGGDFPFYTTGRICGYAPSSMGSALLAFPIGAH